MITKRLHEFSVADKKQTALSYYVTVWTVVPYKKKNE